MKMFFGSTACWLMLVVGASSEAWNWPREEHQASPSVRIDTKVRFVDDDTPHNKKQNNVQSDEIPFKEPTDTEGFYNRPPGNGRFPVQVADHRAPYRVANRGIYAVQTESTPSDGTLDSLQYCKCVNNLDCHPRNDINHACGAGQYLCCYKRPNQEPVSNIDYYNEISDESQVLLPGQANYAGAFLPPRNDFTPPYGQEMAFIAAGTNRNPHKEDVLIGPLGPAGTIGPKKKDILVGPGGATGNIGPPQQPVLVGPGGPTGHIGPKDVGAEASAQVLVGPGGPTGLIGPSRAFNRGVLVGPGGPSGIIGPKRNYNRGVLVGPGGPTGAIGPGYGRQHGPGLLVGPGGPTGIIGPGRQLLVGPGGPTGIIGPRSYFFK